MHYWLMKNEPTVYSIDDLKRDQVYCWDGVRNYQARNLMRDEMKVGDLMLYYHSNGDPTGIAGVGKIVKGPYPDPSQFNKHSKYYDPKATKQVSRWFAVDVAFVSKFVVLVSLLELKSDPFFNDMLVVKKGMRLSVQPVLKKHFAKLAKNKTE